MYQQRHPAGWQTIIFIIICKQWPSASDQNYIYCSFYFTLILCNRLYSYPYFYASVCFYLKLLYEAINDFFLSTWPAFILIRCWQFFITGTVNNKVVSFFNNLTKMCYQKCDDFCLIHNWRAKTWHINSWDIKYVQLSM